ncbi:hypothetical protein BC6_00031 [Bacillus phage BC-6]|nr:hypothetical protein BC6_00031 [Bacillus phage BC-6]
MKKINNFLKSNISIAITGEEMKADKHSEGKIKAFETVLELIRIWEEVNNEEL